MNKLCRIVLLVLISQSYVVAQETNTFNLSLTGGASFPNSPAVFKNYWRIGFHGEISPSYNVLQSLRIVSTFGINVFQFDSYGFRQNTIYRGRSDVIVQGNTTQILSGTLGVHYLPFQISNFPQVYVFGGVGFSRYIQGEIGIEEMIVTDEDDFHVDYSTIERDTENVPMVNMGLGVDIPGRSSPTLFLQGRYNISFTDIEATHFYSFMLGLRFHFL